MNQLEVLIIDIREKLPRLMQLEEGQKLKSLISDPTNDICKDSYFIVGWNEEYNCTIENDHIEIGGYVYIINKDFEVIGKEPMLNDVLEWFATKEITGLHFVTNHFINFSLKNNLPTVCGKWDLSKPYLKDQSNELIEFLLTLKNK